MKKTFVFFILCFLPIPAECASFSKINDLNFGTIIVHPGGGTIRIDASTGPTVPIVELGYHKITTNGSSAHLKYINPVPGQIVTIFYPVSLLLSSGSNTILVNQFALNSTTGFTTTSSDVDFYIGGVLNVNSNQAAGNYSGTMIININIDNP